MITREEFDSLRPLALLIANIAAGIDRMEALKIEYHHLSLSLNDMYRDWSRSAPGSIKEKQLAEDYEQLGRKLRRVAEERDQYKQALALFHIE